MEQLSFSQRLRIARGRRNLTVEGLAKRSGLSTTTIVDLEHGRVKRPRIQTLTALAEALHVEVADLLADPVEEGVA